MTDCRRKMISAACHKLINGLFVLALLIVAVAGFAYGVLMQRLDDEIRLRCESMLGEMCSEGFQPAVTSARRVRQGIEMRGVSLHKSDAGGNAASQREPVVYIDELFVACNTDLRRLAASPPDIQGITLRRATMIVQRRPDGSWDIFGWRPGRSGHKPTGRIRIEDSRITIRDLTDGGGEFSLGKINGHLSSIASAGLPDQLATVGDQTAASAVQQPVANQSPGEDLWKFQGTLLADRFAECEVTAVMDPASRTWRADGSLSQLTLSPQVLNDLPLPPGTRLPDFPSLHAQAKVNFSLHSDTQRAEAIQFAASGSIWDGQLSDRRLPFPLADVRAQFTIDNQGVVIHQLSAQSGMTKLSGTYEQRGFSQQPPLRLHAKVRQLTLDQRVHQSLPAKLQDIWKQTHLVGDVDADLTLDLLHQTPHIDLALRCLDSSATYNRFPYPLTKLRGSIRFLDGKLTFHEFSAMAAGQRFHVGCEIQNPGPQFSGWLTIRSDGPVPLDRNLMEALQPRPRQVVQSLNATGMIRLNEFRVQRTVLAKAPDFFLDADVLEASINADCFPYSISRVSGKLKWIDREWLFQRFRGAHGSGALACEGKWTPLDKQHGLLQLNFDGNVIPLDEQLRSALQPREQYLWSQLRPRGTIDFLSVSIEHDSRQPAPKFDVYAEKWPAGRRAEGLSISIKPTWFPLQMDQVVGSFRYRDGVVELQKLRAHHGPTKFFLDGRCEMLADGRWVARFNDFRADQLRVTHELTSALPGHLGPALTALNLSGPFYMRGKLNLRGNDQPASPVHGSWDLLLNVVDGTLASQVRFDHIFGGMRLLGGYDEDGFHAHGQLDIDSLVYWGAQLTGIRGPLWIDSRQVRFGGIPLQGRQDVIEPVTARAFGGLLSGTGQILLNDETSFKLDGRLDNADLRHIARELVQSTDSLSGQANLRLNLAGSGLGLHTLRGGGTVRLRNANIYELPVMFALLKLLSIKQPDSTAFTQADIDYRIAGENVYFERLEFDGDAISLFGKEAGWMNFDHELGLTLYTRVGRKNWQLPVISDLLDEASRNILQIDVVGTLEQPEFQRRAFPELDETLQSIFQDAARGDSSVNRAATPSPASRANR